MATFHLRYPGGLSKALTFSYDDGVEQDIRLVEIFDKNGLKGTFNINTGSFAKEGTVYPKGQVHRRMTKKQTYELFANSPHEVAVHTLTHPFLEQIPSNMAINEVINDRKNIEEMFGTIARGMAYPFGTTSDEVVAALKACGIVYSRTLGGDNNRFEMPRDFHAWMPTAHHNNPSLFDWIDEFNSLEYSTVRTNRNAPRLMYIWGHSYEFDRDNNWERIEDICSKLSGREDTWYATNIEIYDYVRAYESLVFSADEKKVYNPTNKTVWLTCNYEIYEIEPGETVRIK